MDTNKDTTDFSEPPIYFTTIQDKFPFILSFRLDKTRLLISLQNSLTKQLSLCSLEFPSSTLAMAKMSLFALTLQGFKQNSHQNQFRSPPWLSNWKTQIINISQLNPEMKLYKNEIQVESHKFYLQGEPVSDEVQSLMLKKYLEEKQSTHSGIILASSRKFTPETLLYANSYPSETDSAFEYVSVINSQIVMVLSRLKSTSSILFLSSANLELKTSYPAKHFSGQGYCHYCNGKFISADRKAGSIGIYTISFQTQNPMNISIIPSHFTDIFDQFRIQSVRISYDGNVICVGCWDGKVVLLDKKLEFISEIELCQLPITSCVFSTDNKIIYVGSCGIIYFVDVNLKKIVYSTRIADDYIRSLHIQHYLNNQYLFVGSNNILIKFNVKTKETLSMIGFQSFVLSITSFENFVFGCSDDKTIQIFNSSNGKLLKKITRGDSGPLFSLAFDQNQNSLFVCAYKNLFCKYSCVEKNEDASCTSATFDS